MPIRGRVVLPEMMSPLLESVMQTSSFVQRSGEMVIRACSSQMLEIEEAAGEVVRRCRTRKTLERQIVKLPNEPSLD